MPDEYKTLSIEPKEFNQTSNVPDVKNSIPMSPSLDEPIKEPKHTKINPISFIVSHKWSMLFLVWLIGLMCVLFMHLYRTITFTKKINRCKMHRNSKIYSLIQYYSALLKIKREIRIVDCPYVNIPVVYGALHPTILIPQNLVNNISETKLSCILLHEMCHIKRLDTLKNYLWLLAKSIYWFNPLVWFAYENYLDDVEISCDEKVLSYLTGDEKYEYTGSLIDVTRISQYGYNLPLTVSFCKNKSKIRKRVTNMLNPQKKSKNVNL